MFISFMLPNFVSSVMLALAKFLVCNYGI
jgi:hypothetical protein